MIDYMRRNRVLGLSWVFRNPQVSWVAKEHFLITFTGLVQILMHLSSDL